MQNDVSIAQTPSLTSNTMTAEQTREEDAYTLGVQAYLWGYPLQFYGMVFGKTTGGGKGIGDGEFQKFATLKTAKDRFVVTPNNVTVDAYGVIDISHVN